MSMEINGAAILKAISESSSRFEMTSAQVNEIAVSAIRNKITEKNLSLSCIRGIFSTIGRDDFGYVVEGLSEKDARTILKLDSKNPECKGADNLWIRSHLIRLASGEVDPVVPVKTIGKVSKPVQPKKEKTPKIGKIMGSEAQAVAIKVRKTRAKG